MSEKNKCTGCISINDCDSLCKNCSKSDDCYHFGDNDFAESCEFSSKNQNNVENDTFETIENENETKEISNMDKLLESI